MTIPATFLETVAVAAARSPEPRTIPWPMPGNLGSFVTFETFADWQAFWMDCSLPFGIPTAIVNGYERAQKLYVLAWIDFDLITAGELTALTALEYALKDCYLGDERKRRLDGLAKKVAAGKRGAKKGELWWAKEPSFSDLLKCMIECDELTDDKLGIIRRSGGSVEELLLGERKPSLSEMRNARAHGNPFGSSFQAGLLELVRDLIDYAYRERIAEARRLYPNGMPDLPDLVAFSDWDCEPDGMDQFPQLDVH